AATIKVGYRAPDNSEESRVKPREAVYMLDESEKERWTRRGFLGASSAALAAGMLAANHTAGQSQDPARKAKSERSRSEPVPKNPALDEENLDSVNPPPTDAGGKSFVTDVKEGDLWYFPPGIPHSIQGLPPDGTEFLLVFDDGNFSEYETVLLSDWMAHTPQDIVSRNFVVPRAAVEVMPNKERFIFQAEVPGSLAEDQRRAAGALGASPIDFAFRTMQQPPTKRTKGGEVRIIDSSNFKIAQNIAASLVTLKPGGLRELHWHPNADEWQFFISGKGRMTVFATGGRARTM